MANDFYHPAYGHPPRYDQLSRHATPAPSVSPYAPSEPDLQHPQHSHQLLASDPSSFRRGNEGDPYSENIPLKSHTPYAYPVDANEPPAHWMQQPTHYPPSPEVIEPDTRSRKKKKGFFQKKLAWVTYTLTTVQIVVFIVELVKNGREPSLIRLSACCES